MGKMLLWRAPKSTFETTENHLNWNEVVDYPPELVLSTALSLFYQQP
jgi:hypothetical protein